MSGIPENLSSALPKRYQLQRLLGRGGMATVYLADDVRHERQVAVKVLHPEFAARIAAERFLQEMGIAARLTHPHILTCAAGHHRERLDLLPGHVEQTLVRAMRLRPEDRFLTAGEFVSALDDAFKGRRRYSESEAQEIVRRAAALEAQPMENGTLSLGGIE